MRRSEVRLRMVRLSALVLTVAGLGCSQRGLTQGAALESTTQSLIVAHPSLQVPARADPSRVLLSGAQRLALYDRVRLGTSASRVVVLGGGPTRSEFAAGTLLNGDAWIGASVFLASQTTITGDLRVHGAIEQQTPVTILGQRLTGVPIPITSYGWDIELPATYVNQPVLEPNTQATLAPGAYATIDVRPNATLKLSSGTYFFQTLSLDRDGKLQLTTSNGPVVIYVTGEVRMIRSTLIGANLGGQLLLTYLGTSRVEIDTAFRGTVVAPNATIDMRRPISGKHLGTFFGKEVLVQSDCAVEHEPFVASGCLLGCSGHGSCSPTTGKQAFACQCSGDWVGDMCDINRPILPATPVPGWSLPPQGGETFLQTGQAADGTLLASTGSSVYRIGADGVPAVLRSVSVTEAVELDVNGMGFSVRAPNSVTLYNRTGASVATTSTGTYDYTKVFPGAAGMFVANVVADLQRRVVASAKTVAAGSSVNLALPGIQLSRLSSNGIHYTDGLQTVRVTASGTEQMRLDLPLRDMAVSESGDNMIAELAQQGSKIVHIKGSTVSEPQVFTAPLWDVAISPDGVFSVATWQTGVHVFASGRLLGSYALPIKLAARVAVSNRGEVLVGGKTEEGTAIVLLLARNGNELWRNVGAAESSAYRPDVGFFPGGDAFVIRSDSGLATFTITRS